MISKERFINLIKQGKTLYLVADDNTIVEHNKDSFFVQNFIAGGYDIEDYYTDLNYWFETKEEAQWHIDFTAERVDRLELPMWEKFIEPQSLVCFSDKYYNNYEMYLSSNEDMIYIRKYPVNKVIFGGVAIEENYKEACKLCLKLFKGEEL